MDSVLGPIWIGRLARLTMAGLVVGALPLYAAADAVVQRVEGRLAKAGLDRQGDIRVSSDGGTVVLAGAVTTVDASRQAEKAARKESKAVENRLRVLPEPRPDAEIQKAVERAILGYARYGVFDAVGAGVNEGVVTLTGSVYQPYRREEIDRRVGKVPGVRDIRNEVRVQTVSLFDERLRRELARAIYGDERFVRYAHWPDPPVRIVVDRGRVTLYGTVGSRVEQVMLGHIARGTLAFGVENQVKVEGEEAKEPPKAAPNGV